MTQVKARLPRLGLTWGVTEGRERAAIFYGSTSGSTEGAAARLAREFAVLTGFEPPRYDIGSCDPALLERYQVLLIGCSTWNVGELQADWALAVEELSGLELSGIRVALFGTGDQLTYHDSYLDALGVLAARFEARGAVLAGAWPAAGYDHSASRALRGGRFVGLALDEDNQAALSAARIRRWCRALVEELGLVPAARVLEPAGRREEAAV